MPISNSKDSSLIKEQTVKHILKSGYSATKVAANMRINSNTVCRWVREYRKFHGLPTYQQEKGIQQAVLKIENEFNLIDKEKNRRIQELDEEVEILKKSLRIFMQPQ